MFFLRRRTLILKAVLILTALWFMVALLTTNSNARNAIGPQPIEYEDPEAKPLKMAKPSSTKKKSESYGNNLSDGKRVLRDIANCMSFNGVVTIGADAI